MAREGGNAGGDALVDDGERAARAGDGSWRGERGAAPVMLGSVAAGYLVAVSGSVALTHCVIRRVRHAPTAALSMIAATRNVSAEA